MSEEISRDKAAELCRKITADLPEYFGLPEANKHYITGIHSCKNLAAKVEHNYVGLISLELQYHNNFNVFWMGVFRNYHNEEMGKHLIKAACKIAKKKQC